jgi:hypothetical protein
MQHPRRTARVLIYANGGIGAFCRDTHFSPAYTHAVLRGEKHPSERFREALAQWLGLNDSLIWPESETQVQLTVAQVDEIRASLDQARKALR